MLRLVSRRLYATIDRAGLKAASTNQACFVFDVRDQNEVDGGHIDAANINHIPLDELDEALALSKQNYELIYELTKPASDDQVRTYSLMIHKLWSCESWALNVSLLSVESDADSRILDVFPPITKQF